MRIKQLEIRNFKKFVCQTFELHPQFTLLAGENGAGKTSVLDALAVSLGLWSKVKPGCAWRNIFAEEIRMELVRTGDRAFFKPQLPTSISAVGSIGAVDYLKWTRMIKENGVRTRNVEAREAEKAISHLVKESEAQRASLPVLAYYGAGRAWLPSNKRPARRVATKKPTQFDAYYYCLDTRIHDWELNEWFLFEAAASNGHGTERPGFLAVKQAVLDCIPQADALWYDIDLKEVVLSIQGVEQPYFNLSAGQRMMLALVADIAIKAITLNAYLLEPNQPGATDPSLVLKRTPGVVLIDELDVHLHPRWQRQVAADLKRTFPEIQFVCTSHSPQVIGEFKPEEIRLLNHDTVEIPAQSFGMDSNWVLRVLMGADEQDSDLKRKLEEVSQLIARRELDAAEVRIREIISQVGNNDAIQRAKSTIERIRLLGK